MKRSPRYVAAGACLLALATAAACADRDDAEPADAAPSPDAGFADSARVELDAGPDSLPDATVSYDASSEPVSCAVTPCVVALAAGQAHVCALLEDGTVRCWGDDTKGALGSGDADGGPRDAGHGPVEVAGVRRAVQISAADRATCARLEDGRVMCWGQNDHGQLGLSAFEPAFDDEAHPAPTSVALSGPASRVDVGHGSACAHLESGEVWCWGANDNQQLLRSDAGPVGEPAPSDLRGARFVRTEFASVTGYAITGDRELVSWGVITGRNTSFTFDPQPRDVPTLSGVFDVAASATRPKYDETTFHTCVIASGGVHCWGKTATDDVPALCNGVPNEQRTPALSITSGSGHPQQIAVSHSTTCVRMTDGTIECCGDDARGQLGRGVVSDNPVVFSFKRASALSGYAVQVVTGDTMTCALLREGRVLCWGGNRYGELGQGTVDPSAHPVPLTVSF